MNEGLAGFRILGFCDYFTEGSSGGVERVTAEVYRRLLDQGADVRVVTTAPGTPEGDIWVSGIPTTVVKGWDLSKRVGAQVAVSPGLRRVAKTAVAEFRPHV